MKTAFLCDKCKRTIFKNPPIDAEVKQDLEDIMIQLCILNEEISDLYQKHKGR